jgi:hypothetical protein
MLNSLDFIKDGAEWPPKDADEVARLAEHALMRQVYNGLHERIFPRYVAYLADVNKDAKKQVIILDWPELATSSYLNLLFGEEPEVKTTVDDDALPERPDDEVFVDRSRYGHGMYEVSDEGITAINPENVYLVVQPGNIRNVTAYVIFASFKQTDSDKKEHEYVKFTIHTKGQIQHLVFELVQAKLKGPVDLKAFHAFASLKTDPQGIQKPAVDDCLIVHVHNVITSERYYGRSDYRPSILSLLESLELSFAQRDEVLAKFVNPTPVVPESATTFDHGAQEWVYKPGRPIITSPGDKDPALMVWQAELGAVERSIDQKMDQLLQMLQLSRVLLAGKDSATAESGKALNVRLIPTRAKVSIAAREAEEAIPKVLHLWSQLHPPEIAEKDIHVLLQDGIPEDPLETAQTAQFWDAMGAISLERKLELQGLKDGSDAFNTELARLRGSQQASAISGPPKIQSKLFPAPKVA